MMTDQTRTSHVNSINLSAAQRSQMERINAGGPNASPALSTGSKSETALLELGLIHCWELRVGGAGQKMTVTELTDAGHTAYGVLRIAISARDFNFLIPFTGLTSLADAAFLSCLAKGYITVIRDHGAMAQWQITSLGCEVLRAHGGYDQTVRTSNQRGRNMVIKTGYARLFC